LTARAEFAVKRVYATVTFNIMRAGHVQVAYVASPVMLRGKASEDASTNKTLTGYLKDAASAIHDDSRQQ
jgi:hypothetical protein